MENISYTGEAKKAQPNAQPAFGDLGLAREMALPETTSGGNEMMSSADIERAIPSPAPAPVLPETAFGIGEGYFLTPEQRLQREQERKSTQQGLIDAGIVNIIP
jgi:hypothetical protein